MNDKQIITYIAVGLKNEYIRLSKKRRKILKNEVPLTDSIQIPDIDREEQIDLKILICDAMKILNSTERFVINEVIINDKKEQTVADELHITRQAVNKIKKRALNKIRKILEE